jgi:hypothetical protein
MPKTKKGKKERGKKAEPRQKIYIPPVKPPPVQPDPLETTGLAHSLPADLLIVLRSFNKKAEVTKTRALEELQTGWVDKWLRDKEDQVLEYTLVEMLPVWVRGRLSFFLQSDLIEPVAASPCLRPLPPLLPPSPSLNCILTIIPPPHPLCTRTNILLPPRNGVDVPSRESPRIVVHRGARCGQGCGWYGAKVVERSSARVGAC